MLKFSVPEMSCGHCKSAIEQAITKADPKARIDVDLQAREVNVDSVASADALVEAIKTQGYDAVQLG